VVVGVQAGDRRSLWLSSGNAILDGRMAPMRVLFALLAVGYSLAPLGARAQSADSGESIYKYTTAKGRVVYTNILEQVPLPQREQARVDLSRVELNTEAGTEIDRHLGEEYEKLKQSPYCRQLRAAANASFLATLWDDFAPLLLCGAGLLLLLFASPAAMRRFGAPAWAKVLMMAIPALALGGLIMFSMSYTNKTIVELRHRAKPCLAETFTRLSGQKDAVMQHMQLVDQLKREIASLEESGKRAMQ
jgi:hypothetical protein